MTKRRGVELDPKFSIVVKNRLLAKPTLIEPSTLCQLIWVAKGRILIHSDGRNRAAGRALVVPAEIRQFLRSEKKTELIEILLGAAVVDQLGVELGDSSILQQFSSVHPDEQSCSGLCALFDAVSREYRDKQRGYRLLMRLKVLEILVYLGRQERDTRGAAGQEDSCIAAMRRKIEENYTENFSLPEMARSCGLNTSYFSRAFKESVGSPPFEFINRIRVQKACLLLKRTDMTILEIALSVGYNNISFFNRYFRKIMKMSPREYRSFANR